VFGKALHQALSPAGPSTVIDIPGLVDITPTTTTPPTIGVIADEGSPDNLFTHSLKLIEEALATSVVDPEKWQVALLGSITRAVTLTGSVVPRLTQPQTPTEWAQNIASCSVLVSLGAGTEPAYVAHQAEAAGIHTVMSDCAKPVGDHLVNALRQAVSAKKAPTKVVLPTLSEVAASLEGLWSGRL
jgi:hypothetical protein